MTESKTAKGSWLPESIEQAVIKNGLDLNHAWIVCKAISFYKAEKEFHASNAYLAKALGKNTRQIQRYISKLALCGWLKVKLSKSSSGTSRNLLPTKNTLAILRGDIDVMPRGDIDVMAGVTPESHNNEVDSKASYSKVLTTTSFENDADIFYMNHLKGLISEDLGIDANHEAFWIYEVASKWAKLVTNVNIPEKPNTTIIGNILNSDTMLSIDSKRELIAFLDGRYTERNIEQRLKPVNLSWLMCSEMDDLAKDGILSCEGDADNWSSYEVKCLVENL
ncbi:helix-turn-helix domain-containing protein [Shewanella sp. Isolate11]|uniref:helix-turn-helix domain-containing protein n=1 Tax=Shewanella sp. Isolate11 TaxID=2908530 RepID=UPI001EFE47BF|nr:helix-turn-helix domain-containing protein [Shewanella sp. Isolate11]MCG9697183.1 helix-turn-helix domain-containing protein [Shewanella sp. Isolate11]